MGDFSILAEAFRYPGPGQLEQLHASLPEVRDSRLRRALERFLQRAEARSPEDREMIYTHTFDLSPVAAPYIGWHVWGEDFRRGAFLADLQAAQRSLGIDSDGELSDHLVPVFRYLDAAADPLPDLLQHLVPALAKIRDLLREGDPQNDYLPLLEAAVTVAESFVQQTSHQSGEGTR